jgi:hypothetical protein
MTVKITKSKVSLKGLTEYQDIEPMLMTLTKQYGSWTDQDYETIQDEIHADKTFYGAISIFEKYFSLYVEFTNVKEIEDSP